MNKLNNSVLLDVFSTGNEVQLYIALLNRINLTSHPLRHRFGAGVVVEVPGGSAIFCSHLDTVHQSNKKRDIVILNDELFNINGECGGDDRCGVAVMLQMIEMTIPGLYVFTFNEERGMSGMDNTIDYLMPQFDLNQYTAVICLDRMNDNNIILHNAAVQSIQVRDCYPYYPAHGSVTDGFNLADHLCLPAINLSCGYYAPHTTSDYVLLDELTNLLNTCINYMDWIDSVTYKQDLGRYYDRYDDDGKGLDDTYMDKEWDDFYSKYKK